MFLIENILYLQQNICIFAQNILFGAKKYSQISAKLLWEAYFFVENYFSRSNIMRYIAYSTLSSLTGINFLTPECAA